MNTTIAKTPSRWILKAQRIATALRPPSPGQVEAERPFWGPHPDPLIAKIEEGFYQVGYHFLTRLYGAMLGVQPRELRKAGELNTPNQEGWGAIARLFEAQPANPTKLVADWRNIIDMLTTKLLPNPLQEAQRWAIRAHLVSRLAEEVFTRPLPELVSEVKNPVDQEALSWASARGLEYLTACEEDTKRKVLHVLMASRMNGDRMGKLHQRLFDKFSEQNRDWRRVVLTESAFAVSNGRLAEKDPEEGWWAEYHAAPNACPACKRLHGRRFRLVKPDAPDKNGDTEVWWGKTNIGRSGNLWNQKERRQRTKAELWWPCIGLHPNCACGWVMRRIKA